MGKQPAFQFYPGDWIQDTRHLSLATKGAWIDLLCAMWRSQTRGSLTMPIVGYSRLIGATVDQTASVIEELTNTRVCDAVTDSHGNVTLINRRMVREQDAREKWVIRQKKHRESQTCHADVTPYLQTSESSDSKDFKKSLPLASDLVLTNAISKTESTAMILETVKVNGKGNDKKKPPDDFDSYLLEEVLTFTRDESARAHFQKLIREEGPGIVREAMGETKMREKTGSILNRGAYMTKLIREWSVK